MSRPQTESSIPLSSFEKQRDQLVQEITAAMDSVVYNLDILNRSLKDSIQVGSLFQDSSKLWANFYNSTQTETEVSANVAQPEEMVQNQIPSKPTKSAESSVSTDNLETPETGINEPVSEKNAQLQLQENPEQSVTVEPSGKEISEQIAEPTEKGQPETAES